MYILNWGLKDMKKRLRSLIAGILVFCLLPMSVSAEEPQNNFKNQVIAETLKENNLDMNATYKIVEIKENISQNKDNIRLNNSNSYALQLTEKLSNGDVSVTTYLPCKITEDGVIDSFQYADKLRNTSTVDTNFVDVTITITAHYAQYQCSDFFPVYRHAGVEAKWNASNSTTDVSTLLIKYDSKGDLYPYPDVVNNGISSGLKIQSDYSIRSEIYKIDPIKNNVYITSNSMPYNRVINCSNLLEHGGLIYVYAKYISGGKSYEHDRSYYVYGK